MTDDDRTQREFDALARIGQRHGAPVAPNPWLAELGLALEPGEAVERVVRLAANGDPAVDAEDLLAAMALVPRARASMDELELGLLTMGRGRGLTWQQIAVGLGLGSPQAAQQRFERLTGRVEQ